MARSIKSQVRTNGRVTKRIESWNTRKGTVSKIAVRHSNGTFHGATNFAQR